MKKIVKIKESELVNLIDRIITESTKGVKTKNTVSKRKPVVNETKKIVKIKESELVNLIDKIITETSRKQNISEGVLSSQEEKILNDILNEMNSLNEADFNSTLEKIKNYVKKGLMTTAVLTALLAAPNFTQAQKAEINNIAKTEMTTQKETNLFSTKEWGAIKNVAHQTNAKVIKFEDYDGNYQESLNWGAHKTRGFSVGMSVHITKGSVIIDITSNRSKDGNTLLNNIETTLNKSGFDKYQTDTYGSGSSTITYKLTLKDYQTIIKAINIVSPMLK
jgi:hypothetical protein